MSALRSYDYLLLILLKSYCGCMLMILVLGLYQRFNYSRVLKPYLQDSIVIIGRNLIKDLGLQSYRMERINIYILIRRNMSRQYVKVFAFLHKNINLEIFLLLTLNHNVPIMRRMNKSISLSST
jgi:hypothetical protein